MEWSEEEISQWLNTFFEEYFRYTQKIIFFERGFLEENGFKEPEIDYTRLRRFIETAYNNLLELDSHFADILLRKLFEDVTELHTYYHEFFQKTKITGVVYRRDFLDKLGVYTNLQNDLRHCNEMRDYYENAFKTLGEQIPLIAKEFPNEIERIRSLKNKEADFVHNYALMRDKALELHEQSQQLEKQLKERFEREFTLQKERYLRLLRKCINTKTYYLDKLMWDRAQKNQAVRRFFQNARIDGEYSIKTYLKYYLKTLDEQKGKNNEWHVYLMDIYAMMEG